MVVPWWSPRWECRGGHYLRQRTLTVGEMINVELVPSLTRLDLINKENMLLLVCSEAVESGAVKLETGPTVKFPPTVSVLWVR